jgi:hypothetical protein
MKTTYSKQFDFILSFIIENIIIHKHTNNKRLIKSFIQTMPQINTSFLEGKKDLFD